MSDELFNRVADGLSQQMKNWAWASFAQPLRCESPIEIALGISIVGALRLSRARVLVINEDELSSFQADYPKTIFMVPQFKFENYRIDWALIDAGRHIFVECDGHDFHERTKEQAARDRKKDRAIQQGGHPIFRFTGSEIFADPLGCAHQVLLMLWKLRDDAGGNLTK